MTIYRKKPIMVDATQWTGFKDGPHDLGIVPFLSDSVRQKNDGEGWLETLEGGHIVTPGDWIITGIKGEKYSCKPDIFEATYDRVED